MMMMYCRVTHVNLRTMLTSKVLAVEVFGQETLKFYNNSPYYTEGV